MSKVETIENAVVEFVVPEELKPVVGVLDKRLSISDDDAMTVDDNAALTEEILVAEGGKYSTEDLCNIQAITAKVSAALLYVGSEKTHTRVSSKKDTLRVAGKIGFGNNEMAFSYQPQLKESNADGSPKAAVISVINRQYESEVYRDIRKHVMERSKSLRD